MPETLEEVAAIAEEIAAVLEDPKPAKRKRPAAPRQPEPPSPAVLSLEADVLELVKQRTAAQRDIVATTAAVNQANANMQRAQQTFSYLEQEVQYRMALIAQMKGGTAGVLGPAKIVHSGAETATLSGDAYPGVSGYGVSIPQGVSSIPAPQPIHLSAPGPRIRSESAAGFRDLEASTRAAI
jgi:hypothetical protein